MELHRGDLDELTQIELTQMGCLITSAVSDYFQHSEDFIADRPSKALPTLEDVQTWPESGLGKLMVGVSTA